MNEVTTETKANNNAGLMIFGILAILAIAAIGAYFYMNTDATMEETSAAVARVNGEEISQSEYDRSVAQITGVYATQGMLSPQ